MHKHNHHPGPAQGQAKLVSDSCYTFLKPLLNKLNQSLDRRLVRTLLQTVLVIIAHRHRNQGLVLSELGGYLATPGQARAGTKRLSRLLHSKNWQSSKLEQFLWQHADKGIDEIAAAHETPQLI